MGDHLEELIRSVSQQAGFSLTLPEGSILIVPVQAAKEPGFSRHPSWPDKRMDWLIKHPFCACCGRRTCLTVHHKYPVSWPDGASLELSDENLITLCEWPTWNCHLWVGHLGSWLSRNPTVVTDAAEWLERIKGREYPKSGLELVPPALGTLGVIGKLKEEGK